MVMASFSVRYNDSENAATYPINRPILVPCKFKDTITITLGKKSFPISSHTLLSTAVVPDDPNYCFANIIAPSSIPDNSKLTHQFSCGRADGL
jgi:hypothetical protein